MARPKKEATRDQTREGRSTPEDPLLIRLEGLIDELKSLRYDEDEERFEDIVAELVNFGDRLKARLVELTDSLDYQERRASVLALGRLGYPERVPVLLRRLKDASWKVRQAAAQAVGANPFPEALQELELLATDSHRELRLAALETLGRMGDPTAAQMLEDTLRDSDWRVRQEAAAALGRLALPRSLRPLVLALLDGDEDVRNAAVDALIPVVEKVDQEALTRLAQEMEEKDRHSAQENLTKNPQAPRLTALIETLREHLSSNVDLTELSRFGRVITSPEELRDLDHAFERDKVVRDVLKVLSKEGNNSVILVGEAGVGKTAILHEVARHLAQAGDTAVLETSTPELMVGTKYIGEWETKLRDLIEKIKKPHRVYLYLTNVNDLPGAGTTSSNKQNFVTLLAPYMRRGDITVIGESTAEALRRGIEKDLSIKRLFQTMHVEEPEQPTTRRVVRRQLEAMGQAAGVELLASPEVLELLIDLSGTYYSTMAQPGRSVTVLRQVVDLVLERAGDSKPPRLRLSSEDIIQGLARFTGLPEMLLNDKVPLDTGKVRDFFSTRVLGQPEAVGSMVDLITLIKAGLTDPSKPFGVFLFVGPTGVGKTELAKVMAEFIFGSADRLLRLDLSEYRDYDSFEKLIGGTLRHQEEGRLTGKVRENPFSVILLDEIEKAHPNVFDLFLQVFDDGRLTDSQGRVADFRHTIIIMTSNLASAFTPGGGPGFSDDGSGGLASHSGVLREVQRFFRPEFVNRIDQIVVFRPLESQVMARIARRELGKALMRSGLLRRRLSVDIDPSVVDYLMAQGFSRSFGARPLKRAVETRVMLPVAREIVTRGPGYGGETLRVQVDPDQQQVQIERQERADRPCPELDSQALAALPGGPGRVDLLAPPRHKRAAQARLRAAQQHLEAARQQSSGKDLRQQILELERETHAVTFWDEPQRARQRLQDLAQLQELALGYDRLAARLIELEEPLKQHKPSLEAWHGQLLDWLAQLCDTYKRRSRVQTQQAGRG